MFVFETTDRSDSNPGEERAGLESGPGAGLAGPQARISLSSSLGAPVRSSPNESTPSSK